MNNFGINEMQEMQKALRDKYKDRWGELTPEVGKNQLLWMVGEIGEVIDIVKKHLAQGHELDKDRILGELGDIAWYLAEAATALDMDLEDVLQANIDKLKKRRERQKRQKYRIITPDKSIPRKAPHSRNLKDCFYDDRTCKKKPDHRP